MTSVRVSLSSIADLPQVSLKTVSSHNLLHHMVGAQSTFVLKQIYYLKTIHTSRFSQYSALSALYNPHVCINPFYRIINIYNKITNVGICSRARQLLSAHAEVKLFNLLFRSLAISVSLSILSL